MDLQLTDIKLPSGTWQYRIGRSTVVIYSPWGTRIVRPLRLFQGDKERAVEKWIRLHAAATASIA